MFLKISISAFFLLTFSITDGQSANRIKSTGKVERPQLVVGIVVDQMRWDYLYRYYDRYTDGGFKRLLKNGYSCESTTIPYTPTVTAAGHTCIYTGSLPALHGIVGNDWRDRITNETMYCTQDKTVQTVGSNSPEGQMSPRNMFSTTIGDELRIATNFKSRVFGIALKDRGGILPAGHSANAAYWFDDSTGRWITSTYYMNQLPAWVTNFNSERRADEFIKNPWIQSADDEDYDQSIPDDSAFQRPSALAITNSFPHQLTTRGNTNYNGLRSTPFGNTLTLDFAKQLLQEEKLGKGDFTDMLCISLSSTDYVGHRFGPQARETEDTYLRLDKELAAFFSLLDSYVGKGNWTMFLTADHGAVFTPQYLRTKSIPAGVLALGSVGREMNAAFTLKYKTGSLIQSYFEYQYYFDKSTIDSAKITISEAEDFVIDNLIKRPEVLTAFSYRNFDKVILPAEIKQRFTNGYFNKRSGDIQVILKPQFTEYSAKGTDHGAWYSYDSHIPLLWYGSHIRQGTTNRETSMTDIAATLAALLKIQAPSACVGNVITGIIK